MLYKHWKKIALALTGLFWASCGDSVSEGVTLYGCPPEYCNDEPESSSDESVSSSSAVATSSASVTSSESAESSSSKQKDLSSSSGNEGPQGIVDCYDVSSDRQTLRPDQNSTTLLFCDDGVACQEKVTVADVTAPNCEVTDCDNWVPPTIRDTVYYCINGESSKIFTSDEFRERYKKVEEEIKSSSSVFDEPVTYYGPATFFDDDP